MDRRAALQRELAELTVAELRAWCMIVDPGRAHLGRTQLLRAIEVATLTGQRLSELHARGAKPPRWRARYLVVDPGPVLRERIEVRVDRMLGEGWLQEVRALMARVPGDAPAWNAAGYQAIRDAITGAATVEAARDRVVVETRQYAKRQRTWMRHQLPDDAVQRLDPTSSESWAQAERWWRGESA
jgi:tRNA dimethylallyltransferase